MKNTIALLSALVLTLSAHGSQDTANAADTSGPKYELGASLDLVTGNYCRGIQFGTGPSAIGYLYLERGRMTYGISGYQSLTAKRGYDNGYNANVAVRVGKSTKLVLDEYVFQFEDFGPQSATTGSWYDEFTELRAEHGDLWSKNAWTAAFTLRGTYRTWDTTSGRGRAEDNTAIYHGTGLHVPTFYLQGARRVYDCVYLTAGFTTGPSGVNFYGNGGSYAPGFTNLMLSYRSDMHDVNYDVSVVYNPKATDNMRAGGVGRAPLGMFIKLSF